MRKPSRTRSRLVLTRESLRQLTAPELTVPQGQAWEEETKRACTETCYECTIGTDPN
jgi:hypothetical protein